MIASKEIKTMENSSVELTVTITKDYAKEEYTKLLTKYSKKAQIKGFRKGKVPNHVLEQKFGEEIKEETVINIAEASLKVIFSEIDEKPLSYTIPTLKDVAGKLNFDEDYKFTVVYDVYPIIELGPYKGIEIEVPDTKVKTKDEDLKLEELREQNSIVIEKTDGKVEKNDIVTVNYVEIDDDGENIEGTSREGFIFTVGTGYNLYKFDDDILGMKKGEEKILNKEFEKDFENTNLAGEKRKIKVTVTTIKVNELPKLDDDLAQDISEKYKTLEDLKVDIKKNLNNSLDGKLEKIQMEKLFEKIIEKSKIPIPKSMLKAEMDNYWKNFLLQSKTDEKQILQILKHQGKTKELLLEEWKPILEKSLKVQLLSIKLIEQEKFEVREEELEEEIKAQAENSGQKYDDLKELIEKNHNMSLIESDVKNKKLLTFLVENNTITKGKKVNFTDLMDNNF